MKVTIVDSEPSVVALIDCLDHLPTQPPSLYLDIEGVNICRHGSISILQLFVSPTKHVFLIDVFVLQQKAFCTPNRSGTTLRSILESAQVPKVFFDVRNDSDALFAHFQISMGGVQDVQLLEIATRYSSKKRLNGLAGCIEKDAQLTPEASAAWNATKQKGLALFAPEQGGSFEVFNSRPMLQDIIDYCTQDVVCLPRLWKVYNGKISKQWMVKVQDATCERLRMSQMASYEPHGKNKTLSPWARPGKPGQKDRPDDTGTKGLGRKTTATVTQVATTRAANGKAAMQPNPKPQSQPSAEKGVLRRSARLAALGVAAQKGPKSPELPNKPNLPIRSKNGPEQEPHKKTGPIVDPNIVHSKWTCTPCGRAMQEDQKEEHLAGKQHIARLKQTAARQTNTAKAETLRATPVTMGDAQVGRFPNEANLRRTNPGKAEGKGAKGKKKQTAVPKPQPRGLPYPPNHLFVGFGESAATRGFQYETAFSLEDVNYGVCDKDCGWCGHCMDGIDI